MQLLGRMLMLKPGEGGKTAYFIAFFLLLGVGLAIGKGSADALFIKRYGVEYFPLVYLFLSLHLALFCLLYAAYVDRMSAERFFRMLFAIQGATLVVMALVMASGGVDLVYPLYYIVYALSSELLLVHGAFYIGQNFDTLQAKRLTPVIFAGYQFGMIAGGLVLMFVTPLIGLSNTPLVWLGMTALALALQQLWHRRHGASPYYYHISKSSHSQLGRAVEEIREGFDYTRRSPLLVNAAWALFFMVVTYYMLSYCANTIYTQVFTDETRLASFFGALVIATNVLALVTQLLVTNRLIERLGVRKANTIYPATTILSFVLLLIQPGFYAALFSSFNRETIMPAIRTPVRQLFFNVLPDRVKGRARAISVAIVMPLALFVCGGMILLTQQGENIDSVLLAGLLCSVAYLVFTVRMGREYINTLIASMREKLYLPEQEQLHYNDDNQRVIAAMRKGLNSDSSEVSLSYARALVKSYPQQSVKMILDRVTTLDMKTADQMVRLLDKVAAGEHVSLLEQTLSQGDEHLRATVFDILVKVHNGKRRSLIEYYLNAPNPRLRASAIFAACCYQDALQQQAIGQWRLCLQDDAGCQYASLRLIPLLDAIDAADANQLRPLYANMLASLLASADDERRTGIYRHLTEWRGELPNDVVNIILSDTEHEIPSLRAAAVAVLPCLLSGEALQSSIIKALNDGHAEVRQAALAIIETGEEDFVTRCHHLLCDRRTPPRAQTVLLERMIQRAVSYNELMQLIEARAAYAANLLCAIHALPEANSMPEKLLKTALQERLRQTGDLILLAMQPLYDKATLQVIRSGLGSQDERLIANAIEALSCLTDNSLFELLGHLLREDCERVVETGFGKRFAAMTDVLQWCAREADDWLRECSQVVAATDREQACA